MDLDFFYFQPLWESGCHLCVAQGMWSLQRLEIKPTLVQLLIIFLKINGDIFHKSFELKTSCITLTFISVNSG